MYFADAQGIEKEEAQKLWEESKTRFTKPRHKQVYRFPTFPSCAYVYYHDPLYIEQRDIYWTMLDMILSNGELHDLPEDEKVKILDEIDNVLPRPDEKCLKILQEAYDNGMYRAPRPKYK